MKHILIVGIIFFSCCTKPVDEAALTTQPPAVQPVTTAPTVKKGVVVLGNSIVRHQPLAEIGWNNDWGMAASSRDSDFVHLLMKEVSDLKFKNIADFERGHNNYNLSQLDSLRSPKVLVMRISENVTDTNDFYKNYDRLIKYIGADKVIITNGFWDNKTSNVVIERYASDNNLPFVNLKDLDKPEYKAIGQYQHPGVADHPSDKGMREIKNRIWEKLK